MSPIIGIDLGTTNSVVAVLDGREPRVLVNEEGQRVTPSVVAFDDAGNAVVGAVARRQAITNAARTVGSVKRFMGRRFDDVQRHLDTVSYDIVEADGGDVAILINGARVSPPEIAARVLMKLKRAAQNALGDDVSAAVITVPAYFDNAQRQATHQAGLIAGLDVKRIINEPTAAALAYGLGQGSEERTIAVFDLGGGTFDISILNLGGDVIEVRSTAGDTRLGGDDIDRRIVDFLLGEFREQTGIEAVEDRVVMQRLRDAAERAKIELSTAVQTEIHLPFLSADERGPQHLKSTLSRARLESMIADLVGRALACCERALEDAGLAPGDIDEVLLVGGSTRIPLVQERVRELFGCEPSRTINPDEAVALGAAVQGAILGGADLDVLLLDVTPLTLGIETRGGLATPLIPRNTTIPTRATQIVSTAVDDQRAVEVHVLQGEREFAAENRSLGRFELADIPPMPRAVPKIEVTIELDANGIVSVSATEKKTEKSARIRIADAGGLDEAEIERMVEEAEQAEVLDRERREEIERRNALESAVLQLERRSATEREALTEPTAKAVEDAVGVGRVALAGVLDEAAYTEASGKILEAATVVEDDALAARARRRASEAPSDEPASVDEGVDAG